MNMDRLIARAQPETLGTEVNGGANSDRAEIERARLCLGCGHEVLDGVEALRRRDDQDIRYIPDRGNGGEIARHVIGKIGIDRGCDGVSGRIHQDGVTVGLGLRDQRAADRAPGSAAVLHHDRLAKLRRELLQHDAGHDVGRAAGTEWDDRANGLSRPTFRRGAVPDAEQTRKDKQ